MDEPVICVIKAVPQSNGATTCKKLLLIPSESESEVKEQRYTENSPSLLISNILKPAYNSGGRLLSQSQHFSTS